MAARILSAACAPPPPGLLLAVTTLLFGFGLGIVFGLNEDAIKSRLAASAAAVHESVYQGDSAAGKAVLEKSWVYMQRAHLHAGGLGTSAIGLILVVVLLGTRPAVTRAIGIGLGAGALGYSVLSHGRMSKPGLGYRVGDEGRLTPPDCRSALPASRRRPSP